MPTRPDKHLLCGFSPVMESFEGFGKGASFLAESQRPGSDFAQDTLLVLLIDLPRHVVPDKSLEGQARVSESHCGRIAE